jgi:hypothetical protein
MWLNEVRSMFMDLPGKPVEGISGNLSKGETLMGKRPKYDGRFWVLATANILKSLNHADSHLTIC